MASEKEFEKRFITMLTEADYPAAKFEGTCETCTVTRTADDLNYLRGYFRDCVERGHDVALFEIVDTTPARWEPRPWPGAARETTRE